ncbi:hypothetical protein B0A50_00778 [Salinomyces thailandicus]|uniref:DNA repair protein RAD50 n=1 Tax=Salinomyces thailandicus TaxID=706561 RepID=A0A4U0UFK7_9PEZI|nr:hypothetical protein B0A50_00778 [Salinomyces thailandica]
MSYIDKLSILGVRSFDNVHSETIKFHSPLTLIVGSNGSGKTTIIECLKYVTTGELPPNAKQGGAFIHDPKLCGEKEVLAQVKVSFKSTQGHRMVCTRNLQLTVRKNARSMKTLEGALEILKDGERKSLSTRVADLSSCMPVYLGVSKAILDYVIFCHQEESLWPLSQPAELKKKFDEIFEALKYTKAIENIKVMQKNQKIDLGKMVIQRDNAKTNKDRGKKMEKSAEKLSQECEELRKSHADYDDRIKQAARNAEAAWQRAETAGMTVGELNGKRIEERTKQESVESLRQNLKEMDESDEDLQHMLEQYEERVEHYQADLDDQKSQYQALNGEIQQARSKVSSKEREVGNAEAQAESHERQIDNRKQLVKETARSHNIRGFDLDVDDEQIRAFMERIGKMAREQNATFESARRETQGQLQEAQKELSRINEQKSVLNQRKENSKQAMEVYNRKVSERSNEAKGINVDEGSKAHLESTLKASESTLDAAKKKSVDEDYEGQVSATESELRKLDDQKEKLDAELVEGTRQAGDVARLDFVQKELKDREHRLQTMQGAHSDRIAAVVGSNWTPASVEDDFNRALGAANGDVRDAEKQRDGINNDESQLNFRLDTCKKELKGKQQAMKTAGDNIRTRGGVAPADYIEELKNAEATREETKADIDALPQLKLYLNSCIKVAREAHKCYTCQRGFDKPKDAEILVRALQKTIKDREEQLGEAPAQLKELDKEIADLKAVATDFETWERLREKEIPSLEKQEKELTTKKERLTDDLESKDLDFKEKEAAKRDVEALSRTVQSVSKLDGEIKNFKQQIEELSTKRKAAGLSRGLEEIQEQSRQVNEDGKTIKQRLQKIQNERDRARSYVSSLELELMDSRSKLRDAEHQLTAKLSLEKQIDELKGSIAEERDKIRAAEDEVKNLGPQLSQAQARYDEIAHRGADKDRELQAEATKLKDSLNQLRSANREVDSYLERGGPDHLRRGKREVDGLKKDVSRLEEEQQIVVVEVKKLEEQLRNHADTKRSISDNQRYRRDLRALQQVRREIAELDKTNAEADKEKYEKEGSKWQMQRNKLAAEQATVIGSLKSKDESLVALLADYDTEYKDAARKYKEAHVKVETTKACVEDLGRYGGALDKAIMRYHSIKMGEINHIIDELWRRTYQGTDVDTILIRSESENAKSNKSYNYRVCMVKQEAEMDMRGRCSAGQKVLASIIIRLALAECFGVNCGLLALDEPTTNLDRENIQALAESLAEIVKVRRAQKNFQLIVITHDEDFLRKMGSSDYADVYYRVSRDPSQKSRIERQSIAEVMN